MQRARSIPHLRWRLNSDDWRLRFKTKRQTLCVWRPQSSHGHRTRRSWRTGGKKARQDARMARQRHATLRQSRCVCAIRQLIKRQHSCVGRHRQIALGLAREIRRQTQRDDAPLMISNRLSLLRRVQGALGLSQAELGALLGTSRRTVQRQESKDSPIYDADLITMARHVYPTDPVVADLLAREAGQCRRSRALVSSRPRSRHPPSLR